MIFFLCVCEEAGEITCIPVERAAIVHALRRREDWHVMSNTFANNRSMRDKVSPADSAKFISSSVTSLF